MIYRKPSGVRYVDMCIYIDNNVYTDEYDEDLVFQYLYHLTYMLATKGKFFCNAEDYDNFSIFTATRIFMRLTARPDLPRIDGILNYLKSVVNHCRVDYQNSEFSQTIINPKQEEENNYTFENLLASSMLSMGVADFSLVIGNIPATCEKFLSSVPYRKNSSMWMNIYISVMLTFLNSVTLSNKQNKYLDNLASTERLRDYHLAEQFDDNRSEPPILFHLPDNMSNYVSVLSRQLRYVVAKELEWVLSTRMHTDFILSTNYESATMGESEDEYPY